MTGNVLGALAGLLALASCAIVSPLERRQHADALTAAQGWQPLRLPADPFVLAAYVPRDIAQAEVLTVYIEGDGMAWLSRSQASSDPTPRNPVGLELALRHPQGAAVYLARPCQYVEAADAVNCERSYWTGSRFAPEVIAASDKAIDALKRRFDASRLVLIGYSGGGAVAALVAARRSDVVRLVTVAGNLDHRAWTGQHGLLPLAGSLNPADEWRKLKDIPQLHFAGERDTVIGRAVVDAYVSRFPAGSRIQVVAVPDSDHGCCWADNWNKLFVTHAGMRD